MKTDSSTTPEKTNPVADLQEKAAATHEDLKNKAEEAGESAMATAKMVEDGINQGVEDLKARAVEAHENMSRTVEAARKDVNSKVEQAKLETCDRVGVLVSGAPDVAEKEKVDKTEGKA